MAPPPTNILTMTPKILWQVRTCVHAHVRHWTERARAIPSPELRKQALASTADKTFHCEGGAIYSFLAGGRRGEAVRFIVACQSISDYLDNLCDRTCPTPGSIVSSTRACWPSTAPMPRYARRAG